MWYECACDSRSIEKYWKKMKIVYLFPQTSTHKTEIGHEIQQKYRAMQIHINIFFFTLNLWV